ncbi:MAG: BCAM0308 family protein [Vicinamibacterales bacterium]
MRSHKPYSNVTFTKRVDHDGGMRRPSRAPREPRVCDRCGATYAGRRWALPPGSYERVLDLKPRTGGVVLCPGCRRVDAGVAGGYLTLSGTFVTAHADELLALLRHEAAHALEDNPTARVMSWSRSARQIRLTTTGPHLAQRLGRAVARAYAGAARYDFSHENQLARVSWQRPATGARPVR